MSKLNIRSVLLVAGAIISLVRTGHADDSFCTSQLALANTYLGPIPSVGYQMVTLKLGEAQCFFHRGEIKNGSGVAPTPDTIFELASVTKVFTTAILAMRELQGLNVTAPVKLLPTGYKLSSNEEKVTFQQLATFTGGFDWSDPPGFSHKGTTVVPIWTQGQFVDAVNHLKPNKADGPGATDLPTYMKYSNGSVGFLGQILMNMDGIPVDPDPMGMNFSYWIWTNLTGPLGMYYTAVEPPGTRATGYSIKKDGTREEQNPFPWEPWGAAGGLRSNANDMLKFLKANICAHYQSDPSCAGLPANILNALLVAHNPQAYNPLGSYQMILVGGKSGGPNEQALAWVVRPPSAGSSSPTVIIKKNGGHPGFSSFIGFDPAKKYGLVILMNTLQKTLDKAGTDIIQHTPK
jgi:CubicO group peptidase (beta-lactamase class C family)